MADTPRTTGAPPDAIIIDAPPGGPRGVKKVIIFPGGVGALPYDQRRYFCRVCRDFTGASGQKGDVCTINASHPLRGKKNRGRPQQYGGRHNLARSIYSTYLSWLSYFKYLAWWRQHAPMSVWEEIFKNEYPTLLSWPGGDKGREWNPNRAPAALVIQRLARHHGISHATIRQLIREGRWWDGIEREYLGAGAMTVRACVEPDSFAPLLIRCKSTLGTRRRLTEDSARALRAEIRRMHGARRQAWSAAAKQAWRNQEEFVANLTRLVEVLRNPNAPGAFDAAADLAGKIHVSPSGGLTGPMLLDHIRYVKNDPQRLARARDWFRNIDPRLAGVAIWPGMEAVLAHVR